MHQELIVLNELETVTVSTNLAQSDSPSREEILRHALKKYVECTMCGQPSRSR